MQNFKSSTSVQPFIQTPTCKVCLEPYGENGHTPKILQCAHTVCEECVNVLEEQGRRNNRQFDRSLVNISCPVCRTITQTPRTFIRTNYQLIDVVDEMRGQANLNIVFVTCIECKRIYHEDDANICTTCSPIKENTEASELVAVQVNLSNHSLCSTCLLKEHISKRHGFIRLQPIRVEIQRLENQQRIVSLVEKWKQQQSNFHNRLNETMDKWIKSSSILEVSRNRFDLATDSFSQKKLFDEFVKELTKKTERIESLQKSLQKWSDELENDNQQSPQQPTITPLPPIRPAPPVPNRPPRVHLPHEPLGADYLYYFEQQ